MKGWVYIISNRAMPGLVKVGHSLKDPDLRAEELNHTGSPHPYVVEYEVLVEEPSKIEKQTHKLLGDKGEGKEWFRCSAEQAVAAIKQVVGDEYITESYKKADREEAERIHQQQSEEARKKRAHEDKERQVEQILLNEESTIRQKHQQILAAEFPPRPFWVYFLLTGALVFVAIALFSPKAPDAGSVVVSIIGGAIVGAFVQAYFEKQRKESLEYKAILKRQEDELSNVRYRIIKCTSCDKPMRWVRAQILLTSSSAPWNCPHCKAAVLPPQV